MFCGEDAVVCTALPVLFGEIISEGCSFCGKEVLSECFLMSYDIAVETSSGTSIPALLRRKLNLDSRS